MSSKPTPPIRPIFKWPEDMVANYLNEYGRNLAAQFHREARREFQRDNNENDFWERQANRMRTYHPNRGPVERAQMIMQAAVKRAYGEEEAGRIFTPPAYPQMHNRDFQPPLSWRPSGALPAAVVQGLANYGAQQAQFQQELTQWRIAMKAYHEGRAGVNTGNAATTLVGVTTGIQTMQVAAPTPPTRARTPPSADLLEKADEVLERIRQEMEEEEKWQHV